MIRLSSSRFAYLLRHTASHVGLQTASTGCRNRVLSCSSSATWNVSQIRYGYRLEDKYGWAQPCYTPILASHKIRRYSSERKRRGKDALTKPQASSHYPNYFYQAGLKEAIPEFLEAQHYCDSVCTQLHQRLHCTNNTMIISLLNR